MSRWNGRMGKGAGRKVRETKREEAKARQSRFTGLVARFTAEGHEDPYAAAEAAVRAS